MKNFFAFIFLVVVCNQAIGSSDTLIVNMPTEVTAGDSFDVFVTIKMDSAYNFTRFQQVLPIGFECENLTPEKGFSYNFRNQVVKYMWMVAPAENNIELHYRLKAEGEGEYEIESVFGYLKNNVKKTIHAVPVVLKVNKKL